MVIFHSYVKLPEGSRFSDKTKNCACMPLPEGFIQSISAEKVFVREYQLGGPELRSAGDFIFHVN